MTLEIPVKPGHIFTLKLPRGFKVKSSNLFSYWKLNKGTVIKLQDFVPVGKMYVQVDCCKFVVVNCKRRHRRLFDRMLRCYKAKSIAKCKTVPCGTWRPMLVRPTSKFKRDVDGVIVPAQMKFKTCSLGNSTCTYWYKNGQYYMYWHQYGKWHDTRRELLTYMQQGTKDVAVYHYGNNMVLMSVDRCMVIHRVNEKNHTVFVCSNRYRNYLATAIRDMYAKRVEGFSYENE